MSGPADLVRHPSWARAGLSAAQADTQQQIVRCPGCGAWDLDERVTTGRHCRHAPPTAVPATGGVARRLRALAVIGWGAADLAPLLGVSVRTVERHQLQDRQASTATQHAVEDLYERLCMTTGPSALATARARRRQWAPPLAWDEDTIDDGAAAPAGTAPPTSSRMVSAADRVEDITWCARQGMTTAQTAERLGIRHGTVTTTLNRAGAHETTQLLARNNRVAGRRLTGAALSRVEPGCQCPLLESMV